MKTLKYILLSCVVLGAVACDDFLVETPDTSVEKSGVYNSLSSSKGRSCRVLWKYGGV